MVPWACHKEDGAPGRDDPIEAQVARTEHDGCQEARRAPELRHSHRVVSKGNLQRRDAGSFFKTADQCVADFRLLRRGP